MRRRLCVLIAAAFAAVCLFGGSAEASCHSVGVYKPVVIAGPNITGVGDLACTGADQGEVWVFVDYLDQNIYPPQPYFAALLHYYPGRTLDPSHGSGVSYIGNPGVACSALSRQYYRTRINWFNWDTVQTGSSWSLFSDTLLC